MQGKKTLSHNQKKEFQSMLSTFSHENKKSAGIDHQRNADVVGFTATALFQRTLG